MFLIKAPYAGAVVDPLTRENNKVGVHILDPNEVDKVADLVNTNGGDWGYVTVPLRADDRDRPKWQNFFDICREKHLIPLIRLATVMNSHGWEKPTLYDSVDFANFLNDLDWPTKNRYIIVYNEPNHPAEWGGAVDPQDYGRILFYTNQIFKQRNEDFFILQAGLDAAAPDADGHMSLYRFLVDLNAAYPQALKQIDGWTSHSYPNPAFSGRPWENHHQSITGYRHEADYLKILTGRSLPIFITETGWSDKAFTNETLSLFYENAFSQVWLDQNLVAVTPFLLIAGDGPFQNFSLEFPDGSPKAQYLTIKEVPKTKGNPEQILLKMGQVLGEEEKEEGVSVKQEEEAVTTLNWDQEKWRKLLDWLILK